VFLAGLLPRRYDECREPPFGVLPARLLCPPAQLPPRLAAWWTGVVVWCRTSSRVRIRCAERCAVPSARPVDNDATVDRPLARATDPRAPERGRALDLISSSQDDHDALVLSGLCAELPAPVFSP